MHDTPDDRPVEPVEPYIPATPIVIFKGDNPMELSGGGGPLPAAIATHLPSVWPGLVLMGLVLIALYLVARGRRSFRVQCNQRTIRGRRKGV